MSSEGKVYVFKLLGSVTECEYDGPFDSRTLKETKGPEPTIIEFKIPAYSRERAEIKLKRYIAWNFESNFRNYGDS